MKKRTFKSIDSNQDDWWINGRADIVLSIIRGSYKKNSKILDVGAGIGLITGKIKKAGYKNIIAADASSDSLEILKNKGIKALQLKLPEIKINSKYDLVLLLDVIEHVKDDQKTLINIKKILNKNGKIIVTVPAFKFLWSKKDEEYGHFRRYTRKELRDKIGNAGYKIDYLSYYNFFLFLPALIAAKINKKKMKVKRYSSKQNRIFYPIFRQEACFIRRGLPLPFGVSLIAVINND